MTPEGPPSVAERLLHRALGPGRRADAVLGDLPARRAARIDPAIALRSE